MTLLGGKQVAHIGEKPGFPYWGTSRFSLLRVVLIGAQTGCSYLGTNRLPLLGDKQVVLIELVNRLSLLRDKQVALIEG